MARTKTTVVAAAAAASTEKTAAPVLAVNFFSSVNGEEKDSGLVGLPQESLTEIPCSVEKFSAQARAIFLNMFEKSKFSSLYLFCKELVATKRELLDEEDGEFPGARLVTAPDGKFLFRVL
jgi:hypothetical protein